MPGSPDSTLPDVRLFVYGLLLQGEREHALLEGAPLLGEARTLPQHTLVDLDFYPVLLTSGGVAIVGELYQVSRQLRFKLDVHHQCPALFRRVTVRLDDGTEAETYAMDEEKVRGKRRLKNGSWRGRFEPRRSSAPPGPMTHYAKTRFS
ncbi:MAG TPA: gamma-glutamylcyclotransferase family protein [Polyangiaceae bacterium]|nr:gamma-glutamylcyclotransferase family protein [Polyangiaceae bacterium]